MQRNARARQRAVRGLMLGLVILLMVGAAPAAALANAAEPPSVIILVENPPEDLVIRMTGSQGIVEAQTTEKMMETVYAFYRWDLQGSPDDHVVVETAGRTMVVDLPEELNMYNNLFTLDLEEETLNPGKRPGRTARLVGLRMGITLLLEGAVFWLMGFRHKRSWMAFGVINLITQGALNLWLNSLSPLAPYLVMNLVFAEVLVLVAELVGFQMAVREKSRGWVVFYVVIANLVSLMAGGWLITRLPI